MPTPEAHAQSVVDLIVAAGGGATGGAIALEIVRWAFGRRRAGAEAEKLTAEAEAALDRALTERIQNVLAADQATIARHEATIREMREEHHREVDRLWRYITVLRNTMISAAIPVPMPPACDAGDRPGASPHS